MAINMVEKEKNMVNQAEQPIESTPASMDTGDTTTDITEDFSGVDTFEDVTTPAEDSTTEPSSPEGQESLEASSVPSNAPLPTDDVSPASPDNVQQFPPQDINNRVADLEAQNAQYQKAQYEAALNEQYTKYKTDLENNGYLPDQAEHVARTWLGQVSEQARAQNEQQMYAQFLQGQQSAAEHFAARYNLGINDLAELRQHRTPESMEAAAKRISSDREKDAEIARLRAQLVPTQDFNDNQSTPAATNDEDRWLERYNQGDRSPQAEAAAKRAAGLG